MISLEQSICIYAQASRAWFGHNAAVQAALKAEQCRATGDNEGVDVWLRVKYEVQRLDRDGVPRFTMNERPSPANWGA